MAIEIDGKVYRNLQEQVQKNMDDIEDLKEHGTGQTYTAGYGITFDEANEIAIDTEVVATKNDILEYESGDGILITTSGDNLRQISVSSDVAMKSDLPIANPTIGELDNPIQLEHLQVGENKYWIPTDTSDLTNDSGYITIADVPVPTAGTGIDITNGQISVDNTVITKNTDGNVQALYLPSINSIDGEDSDCKGRVNLSSGTRRGIVTIEADGESDSASIEVRGSTSGEGMVTITGDVTIDSNTRPKVGSGLSQEQIAYLSDIPTLNRYYVQFDVYSGSDHYVISAPFVTFDTLTTGSTTFADIKKYLQEYMFAVEDNILNSTCGCINTISNSGCTFYYNDSGTTATINISSSDAVMIGQ